LAEGRENGRLITAYRRGKDGDNLAKVKKPIDRDGSDHNVSWPMCGFYDDGKIVRKNAGAGWQTNKVHD